MIEDILVHVDGTEAGKRRIAYAFDLAERHQARLTGVHVTAPVDVPPYYKPSMVDQVATALEYHATLDAQVSEQLFEAAASARSTPTLWRAADGAMSVAICKLARWSDLVVLGQYEREGTVERHPFSLAQAVAVDCGRPVLVVPAAIGNERMSRALVAWDGSREAVRALHDALPLLRVAKATVELAMINGEAEGVLEPLCDHLRRHQISVEEEAHLHKSGSTADALVERLEQGHFDLLIMGALSHSHPVWIEFLFGGTTSSALFNASTPVLISG